MSFQFKCNMIIYIYLQISTIIYTVCRYDSLVIFTFPLCCNYQEKNVCIPFERNNKYNFIKGLTKALALIHLQITIHNWELWSNSSKATEHIRDLSTKLFYINLSENISYGFVRH